MMGRRKRWRRGDVKVCLGGGCQEAKPALYSGGRKTGNPIRVTRIRGFVRLEVEGVPGTVALRRGISRGGRLGRRVDCEHLRKS